MTALAATTSSIRPASSQQVRNKYLKILGISNPNNGNRLSYRSPIKRIASGKNGSSNLSYRRRAPVIRQEALKYNESDDEPNRQNIKVSRRKSCITFDDTVAVVPIPMRNEYSQRTRVRLWSGAAELRKNAVRNSVEFAAEGWDWRSVTDDDNMYICASTGALIHPIHINKQEYHGFRL